MRKDDPNNEVKNDFDIFNEIFILLKLANKYYESICKKFNLTQVQFEVLFLLFITRDNSINMSTLGDKLEIAKSRVTMLVDKMALAGLVKRRPDVKDRRTINIILTQRGSNIMRDLFPNNEVFRTSILDSVQQNEKEFLYKLIIKIKEKLESKL